MKLRLSDFEWIWRMAVAGLSVICSISAVFVGFLVGPAGPFVGAAASQFNGMAEVLELKLNTRLLRKRNEESTPRPCKWMNPIASGKLAPHAFLHRH